MYVLYVYIFTYEEEISVLNTFSLSIYVSVCQLIYVCAHSGELNEVLKSIPGVPVAEGEKLPLQSVLSAALSREQMVPYIHTYMYTYIHT